ncbi:MAG: hypothetical protein RBS16_02230 [Candidatus Cloacimonadales bacterium]|nr:hypothetical protein [Candidatus Cloacimonadota bacterium]MDD2650960.1 hypothetical protein [Candidatus Cloacimonadota bacterium]MDD3500837.1 hypothetical protein [Candidatus Cloacimonadota bacterium]MDX9976828.1 hypothetical protein [Candidatus Cloacimonadales bacterium]
MKHLMILISLLIPCLLFSTAIKDIQFTNDAGFDGTYPSPYLNQQVSIEGIVTAKDFLGKYFVVSEPQGGPWNAISVINNGSAVEVGSMLKVEGKVLELHGMTCIRPTNVTLLGTSQNLPPAYHVTLYELNNNEAYESVLVKVINVNAIKSNKNIFQYAISSNSETAYLGDGFGCLSKSQNQELNNTLLSVIGIVSFSNNRYSLNPRDFYDLIYQTTGTKSNSWGKIKSLYR